MALVTLHAPEFRSRSIGRSARLQIWTKILEFADRRQGLSIHVQVHLIEHELKKNLNLTTLTRVSIYVYRPRLAALTLGHLAADHVGIYRWGPEYWVGTASHKILMWQTQSMICPLYGAILFYLRPNGAIEWNGCRAVNVNLKVHIFRKLQFR